MSSLDVVVRTFFLGEGFSLDQVQVSIVRTMPGSSKPISGSTAALIREDPQAEGQHTAKLHSPVGKISLHACRKQAP